LTPPPPAAGLDPALRPFPEGLPTPTPRGALDSRAHSPSGKSIRGEGRVSRRDLPDL
jgi:hypothetical protein